MDAAKEIVIVFDFNGVWWPILHFETDPPVKGYAPARSEFNQLIADYGHKGYQFRGVIGSSHRPTIKTYKDAEKLFEKFGIKIIPHDDFKTPIIGTFDNRGAEIEDWQKRNPHALVIVLDDDETDLAGYPKYKKGQRHIRPDRDFGMRDKELMEFKRILIEYDGALSRNASEQQHQSPSASPA